MDTGMSFIAARPCADLRGPQPPNESPRVPPAEVPMVPEIVPGPVREIPVPPIEIPGPAPTEVPERGERA